MNYESFVAYSCFAIAIGLTIYFLYWIVKCRRDNKKRHEEFQREYKAIEESIRRQRAMIEGVEVVEQPCRIVNDEYAPLKVGVRVAPHPKPKKAKETETRMVAVSDRRINRFAIGKAQAEEGRSRSRSRSSQE